MRWAIGRGVSQSGNYLRAFINLGFNTAENGQIVFDGLNPIVGHAHDFHELPLCFARRPGRPL